MEKKEACTWRLAKDKIIRFCSFMCADHYLIVSNTKMHLEQVMKELIEEAER